MIECCVLKVYGQGSTNLCTAQERFAPCLFVNISSLPMDMI